jgi:hypothetical protein
MTVSSAGTIYQAMVKELLAAEYDRRTKLEGRGSTIVTASASLVTLFLGLTAVVAGKDFVFSNGWVVFALLAALGAFVVSAALGIAVQNYPFPYWTVSPESLQQLTNSVFWDRPADHAVRDDISQQVTTICTLRDANQKTARLVTISLVVQLIAIVLLSVSVGLDFCLVGFR